MDDPTKRGPADRTRINVHEPYELRYWADKFGVTEQRIRNAAAAVGPMVDHVRRHLGK
jgi:hypothetical protein